MQEQNYKNHMRKAPMAYYAGILMGLIVFIGSIIKFVRSYQTHFTGLLTPILLAMLGIGLILIGYYVRMFALKAQDRAIRAEENLRHFALTGKLLDKKLKLSQVIALRFASDEEFLELAKRAAEENLNKDQIKSSVKNWRADYYRV